MRLFTLVRGILFLIRACVLSKPTIKLVPIPLLRNLRTECAEPGPPTAVVQLLAGCASAALLVYQQKVLVMVVGVATPQQHEPRNLTIPPRALVYCGKDLVEHEPFERFEVTLLFVLWQLNRVDIHGVFSFPPSPTSGWAGLSFVVFNFYVFKIVAEEFDAGAK
jgi:hypothetical protein